MACIGAMDEMGRMDTPMHRVDPRAKAVVTFAFAVTAASFPKFAVAAMTPLLAYPVAMMALGSVPPGPILRKVLLALPFALAVAILNPLMDTRPALAAGPVIISYGWLSLASTLLRFSMAVGAVLCLVATTGMYPLCAALERIGVPRLLATQLLFLHRYLFVLADEASRTMRGVEARAGRPGPLAVGVYGSLVGNLLLRAMDRAGRVHQAMVSRGFDGTVRVAAAGRMRAADWAFIAGWIAFFTIARSWNLAGAFGTLATELLR
jgi:cobalt/nickel transport system permease protein